MRQMLGAFFRYEKTLLVAKLKGARIRARAANGVCEGRKPYGTRPGESEVSTASYHCGLQEQLWTRLPRR
jgi:hypothetical protein